MQVVTSEWLQAIETLHDVPLTQLQWWIDNSSHYELKQDTYLFKEGDRMENTHVIISGRIRIFMVLKNSSRNIGFFEAKDVTGYLPFSRAKLASMNGMVDKDVQLMSFPLKKMKELIEQHYELTQALVHIMTSRVRDFTTMQQQNEKMMALGKLSAGLAHELNNPASAIVRGSVSLMKHLKLQPETFKKVIAIKMTGSEVDQVITKMFEILSRKEKRVLTLMQQTSLEDDMTDCLDNHNVDNGRELAENFIDFGFTCEDMDEFSTFIPIQYLSPVLNWINNNLVTEKMVNDIQEASQRIEKLVGAIKNFTHMDRDHDKEFTDVHSGIKNTLTMLGYKLKRGSVELVEDYDKSLPPVNAYVGELNQIWTNLIDNALDAMEVNNKGRLEIKTKRDKEFVQVTIADNGVGIPEDIKNKIFDPFFTTKEIGKGTGLGLDVVTRIVRQHGGSVKLDSMPGRTAFVVCFPINNDQKHE